MYGVILWSDPDVRKAVIWCEDSGYLAYYEAPDEQAHPTCDFFDTGDYVEFELMDDLVPRRARNAETLRSGQYPRVTRTLHADGCVPVANEAGAGGIIRLSDHRKTIQLPRTSSDLNRRG